MKGAFKVRMCGEGLCFLMTDEMKAKVKMRLGYDPGFYQHDLWG